VDVIEWKSDLSDGVVLIRRYEAADAPVEVQAYKDDPTLGIMLGSEKDPTVEELTAIIKSGNHPDRTPTLAIADASSGEFLGGIGLYRADHRHRRGEVGFWLTPAARGRGVATRAIRLITDWAFDQLAFDRVELTTTPNNDATRALALKLGFTEEGTLRKRNFERGQRVDVIMFAVLKDEWRS
jgi:RimJ/RimL family protein N-acetyltransferase